MRWKTARTYKGAQFKRLVGVERETFDTMVSELKRLKPPSQHKVPGKKRGLNPKLIAADEVLMVVKRSSMLAVSYTDRKTIA